MDPNARRLLRVQIEQGKAFTILMGMIWSLGRTLLR